MYIYKFTHIDTGRCYIGQTIQDPNQRRLEHILDSRDSGKPYHFHNALRKYGTDAFNFEVIAEAKTIEELNLLETFYIEQHDSIENGFNIRQGGDNKIHHPDSIKRMSEAQKAAHARRRLADGDIHKPHKKHIFTKPSPLKGKETTKWKNKGTMGWKLVNGIRIWYIKEASA